MGKLLFLTHIPLLRIEEEQVPFAGGTLWQVPFETYDELSLRAFSEQRKNYEGTSPVFYSVQTEMDLPNLAERDEPISGVAQLKMPSNNWQLLERLELGFVTRFHEFLADRAWAALLLAAPRAALPAPRTSTTFVVSDSDATFKMGNIVCQTISVQGDADHEYLFLPATAGVTLPAQVIEKAEALVKLVDAVVQNQELAFALSNLVSTSAPVLSSSQKLTLAVIALEALLLPEVKSGLGATFARRVAALLAADSQHRATIEHIARQLYDSRSAGLHGGGPQSPQEAEEATQRAYAQQLLSAAIVALTGKLNSQTSLEQLRAALDGDSLSYGDSTDRNLPLADPPGWTPENRLGPPESHFSVGWSSEVDMTAPEGSIISWSPLIGLGAKTLTNETSLKFGSGEFSAPILMPMSGSEILSMEDKDIRRDFVAELRVHSEPVAGILAGMRPDEGVDLASSTTQLLSQRDQAVLTLRLAGFSAFVDPEKLGEFVYEGKTRYRRPTVLRQTILEMMRLEPEQQIGPTDAERIQATWSLLDEYKSIAPNHEIDHVLSMFRAAFDRRFLPVDARAGLILGALEALLGRFRSHRDKVQLEDLVSELPHADSDAVRWFREHGRRFRNSVAHGHWDRAAEGDEPLERLLKILAAAIPAFVRTWLESGERESSRPARLFIDSLTSQTKARREK